MLLFHGSSPHSFQRLSEEETENHGFFFSCYNINHLTLSGHSPSMTRKLYTPICWISFLPFFIENNPYFKNRLSWLTLPFFFTFWHMYKQLLLSPSIKLNYFKHNIKQFFSSNFIAVKSLFKFHDISKMDECNISIICQLDIKNTFIFIYLKSSQIQPRSNFQPILRKLFLFNCILVL